MKQKHQKLTCIALYMRRRTSVVWINMFVAAAKLSSCGLKLLRLATQKKALSLPSFFTAPTRYACSKAVSSSKHLGKRVKKVIAESPRNYILKTKKHFNEAAKELDIPQDLHPKIVFQNMFPNQGGSYSASQHTIFINKAWMLIDRAFPGISKRVIRHEMKHCQQFTDIARSGANSKLPADMSLPTSVAKAAEALSPTLKNASAVEERIKQAFACVDVNKKIMQHQSKFGDFIAEVMLEAISQKESNGNSSLRSLEEFLADGKKIKKYKKRFALKLAASRRASKKYLNDVFEREARDFGRNYGLRKLLSKI